MMCHQSQADSMVARPALLVRCWGHKPVPRTASTPLEIACRRPERKGDAVSKLGGATGCGKGGLHGRGFRHGNDTKWWRKPPNSCPMTAERYDSLADSLSYHR